MRMNFLQKKCNLIRTHFGDQIQTYLGDPIMTDAISFANSLSGFYVFESYMPFNYLLQFEIHLANFNLIRKVAKSSH